MFEIGTIGYLTDRTVGVGKEYVNRNSKMMFMGAVKGYNTRHYLFKHLDGKFNISISERDIELGFYTFDTEMNAPTKHRSKRGTFTRLAEIKQTSTPSFMVGNQCHEPYGKE